MHVSESERVSESSVELSALIFSCSLSVREHFRQTGIFKYVCEGVILSGNTLLQLCIASNI